MTEAEMFEMTAMYISNAMTAFNTYLTVVFAYLAVSYFAGKRLSPLQTSILTVLFVVAAIVALLTFRTQTLAVIHFQNDLNSLNDVFAVGNAPVAQHLSKAIFFLFAGGIFASMYFMFDIRRKNKADS